MALTPVGTKRSFDHIYYSDENLQGTLGYFHHIPHSAFDTIPAEIVNHIFKNLTFNDLNNLLLVGWTFWKIFRDEGVKVTCIPEYVILDMDLEDQEPTLRTCFWASFMEVYFTEAGEEDGCDIEFDIIKINNCIEKCKKNSVSKLHTFVLSFVRPDIGISCQKLATGLERNYKNLSQIRSYLFNYEFSEHNCNQFFKLISEIKNIDNKFVGNCKELTFKIIPNLELLNTDSIKDCAVYKKNMCNSLQKFLDLKVDILFQCANEDSESKQEQIKNAYRNKIGKTDFKIPLLEKPYTFSKQIIISSMEDATGSIEIPHNTETLVFNNLDFNVFYAFCKQAFSSGPEALQFIKSISFHYIVNKESNLNSIIEHLALFKGLKQLILVPIGAYWKSIAINSAVQQRHESDIDKVAAFAQKTSIELKIDFSKLRANSIDADNLLEADRIFTDDEDFRPEVHEFIDVMFSVAEEGIRKAAALAQIF